MNSHTGLARGLLLAILLVPSVVSAQQLEIASLGSTGAPGNGPSTAASMSADGRFIAFASAADNLVPNDTNGTPDVFVRDVLIQVTVRVSVSSSGQQGNAISTFPGISADGSRIAFFSRATNFAPGTTGLSQIFVHDLPSGTTTLASVDAAGVPLETDCVQPRLSADGRHVVFIAPLPGFVATNPPPPGLYVRDLQAQATTRLAGISDGPAGQLANSGAQVSQDGRWVAFNQRWSAPGIPLTVRIVIVDRDHDLDGILDEPGTLKRVLIEPLQPAAVVPLISASRNGRFLTYAVGTTAWLHDRDADADGTFDEPSAISDVVVTSELLPMNLQAPVQVTQVSDDGRYVALAGPLESTPPAGDVVAQMYDMQTGGIVIQSFDDATGATARIISAPTIASDGSFTAAVTLAGLAAGDVNGQLDVYRFPRKDVYCAPPYGYGMATANSASFLGANLEFAGSLRISDDQFTLIATYVPHTLGQFFYGPAQASAPFGDGNRLVGPGSLGLFRLPIVQPVGNSARLDLHFGSPPANAGPGHITPGSQWNFQYVFRDPGFGTFGFNTSPALHVTFCP